MDDDFFRQWGADEAGARVLVGLSAEETAEYLAYLERRKAGHVHSPAQRHRFLALHQQHEARRMEILGAEIAARDAPNH